MRPQIIARAIFLLLLLLLGGMQTVGTPARASLPSPAAAKPPLPAADQPQPPPLRGVAQVSATLEDATGGQPVHDINAKPPANPGKPAGSAPAAPPVQKPRAPAATCTSTGSGNWSSAGIWSCGFVP